MLSRSFFTTAWQSRCFVLQPVTRRRILVQFTTGTNLSTVSSYRTLCNVFFVFFVLVMCLCSQARAVFRVCVFVNVCSTEMYVMFIIYYYIIIIHIHPCKTISWAFDGVPALDRRQRHSLHYIPCMHYTLCTFHGVGRRCDDENYFRIFFRCKIRAPSRLDVMYVEWICLLVCTVWMLTFNSESAPRVIFECVCVTAKSASVDGNIHRKLASQNMSYPALADWRCSMFMQRKWRFQILLLCTCIHAKAWRELSPNITHGRRHGTPHCHVHRITEEMEYLIFDLHERFIPSLMEEFLE